MTDSSFPLDAIMTTVKRCSNCGSELQRTESPTYSFGTSIEWEAFQCHICKHIGIPVIERLEKGERAHD